MTDSILKALARGEVPVALVEEELRGTADMSDERFATTLDEVLYLRSEVNRVRAVLRRYMAAYPAFRIKPIGAPNSPARIEQENLMALEDAANAVLAGVNQEERGK